MFLCRNSAIFKQNPDLLKVTSYLLPNFKKKIDLFAVIKLYHPLKKRNGIVKCQMNQSVNP